MTVKNKKQIIKEMLKENQKGLLFSSIVILLPMIVGLVFWNELPEQMATHWGISGEADGWSGRFFAVFFPPLFILITHWICVFFTFLDKKNKDQSKKALGLIFWITPMISLFANATIYAAAFGKEFSTDVAMIFLIGFMFVVIGNYLPKCKQNYTLGIKIKWALENEENWNATHRFSGKVWVIGGLIMMADAFLPEMVAPYVMIAVMLVLVVVPVSYSYMYHRKQCQEGTAVVIPMSTNRKLVSAIILVCTLLLVVVTMFTGTIKYELGEESFTIKATYWSDMTVDYEKITNVEYRDMDEPGSRTSGFGSAKLLMGSFQNAEFGLYTRYSYTQCDSCIVVEMGDSVLVIGDKNAEKTKQLYEELCQKIGDNEL